MILIFSQHKNEVPKFLLEDPSFRVVDSVEGESLYLYFADGKLALMTPTTKSEKLRPFFIDFIGPYKYHLRQNYAPKKEPLAKALGINCPLVWDITCGVGSDSILFLHFCAKVVAFERNPIMWALLRDAKERAEKDPSFGHHFTDRFTLIKGDPRDFEHLESPDSLFYDPMYPEIGRKALQKKEMRIIREVVGDDPDFEETLKWAHGIPKSRLVVKRPTHAPELALKPGHIFAGKSTRYDVYFS